IFAEVLIMARAMGMGNLGIVAVDGSKVQANSGIESFRSVAQWRKKLLEAREETRRILDEADLADREENARYGEDIRGDEMPEGLEKTEDRIKKIEELL